MSKYTVEIQQPHTGQWEGTGAACDDLVQAKRRWEAACRAGFNARVRRTERLTAASSGKKGPT